MPCCHASLGPGLFAKARTQLEIEHKKYKEKAPSVYLLDVSEIVPGAQGAGRMAAARMCPSRRELARQRVANTFDEGSC